MPTVYFPTDEFSGSQSYDVDLAADFLELKAVLSQGQQSFGADIIDVQEEAREDEYDDVDAEMLRREEVAAIAVNHIARRGGILGDAYPFSVDQSGDVITFAAGPLNVGQTAYLVSLLLSNLPAVTDLLQDNGPCPSADEIRRFRQWFQYIATAAIAAEVRGNAWSFGFPRPDGTGFIEKLSEIWSVLEDGHVRSDPSAPAQAKDDDVDVLACRKHKDGQPGFLLIAAQVATGKNWKNKSLRDHAAHVFPKRWFSRPPATHMIPYHVIPFARPNECFRDDVVTVGNVLHRLRVPVRVLEAVELRESGACIEAFERLDEVTAGIVAYLQRVRTA